MVWVEFYQGKAILSLEWGRGVYFPGPDISHNWELAEASLKNSVHEDTRGTQTEDDPNQKTKGWWETQNCPSENTLVSVKELNLKPKPEDSKSSAPFPPAFYNIFL